MCNGNGKITDYFKQKVTLCHIIRLVKDHASHLVNQSHLSLFEKC